MKFAIAIHGGAGPIRQGNPDAIRERYRSMQQALEIGVAILEGGGTSLDAVETVVRFLEDDPRFNAGKGAVMNAAGEFELDASIMDGSTKACGAVAAVRRIKNPISAARLVMTQSPHILLVGAGAEEFALEQGLEFVEQEYFATPATIRAWERVRRQQEEADPAAPTPQQQPQPQGEGSPAPHFAKTHRVSAHEISMLELDPEDVGAHLGTVGCVALDQHGNLAAATSTGGMTNKRFGRVGDTPIIGAGNYADNETCAVSCTGIGEQFIRNVVAYDVSALMRYKELSVDEAVQEVIENRLRAGDGGIIAVGHDGSISMRLNTGGMIRAAADSNGRREVIWEAIDQLPEDQRPQ